MPKKSIIPSIIQSLTLFEKYVGMRLTMAKKGNRELIKLESTAGTGFFYVTQKNKNNTKEKLLLKKFDPKIQKHVDFKETKLK